MITFKSVRAAAACALIAATAAGFYAAPVQARTAAEETHCRAVGVAFSNFGSTAQELSTMMAEQLGDTATAEDKQTIKDFAETGAMAGEVGTALQSAYAHAAAPSEADIKALDETPLDQLLAQAKACV